MSREILDKVIEATGESDKISNWNGKRGGDERLASSR